MVLDPAVLEQELGLLPPSAKERFTVDGRCTLVSPLEKDLDAALEAMRGPSAIGTTGRGIGPAYAMRAFRLAPRASDLVSGFDYSGAEALASRLGVVPRGMDEWMSKSKKLLAGLVGDAAERVESICGRGGAVLFEGSQGTLLDLLHGTYPYVTSTHTTASYVAAGMGIPQALAGEPTGVMKCYTTRVGSGPFPTELSGPRAERLRALGHEYGATTGRPRRVGWLDLVALKYAVGLNGTRRVAVTKLDVLAQVDEMKVCTAYSDGGTETSSFLRALPRLGAVEPVYEEPFTLTGAKFGEGLPAQARRLVEYIEDRLGVKVAVASYGEERTRTVRL